MPERQQGQQYGTVQDARPHTADDYEYPRTGAANHHPTVKPIALMRWLVRLVTPPDGLILDPFLGSGTTGIAAVLEGFHVIGIEQDSEYLDIARRRIAHWQGPLFAHAEAAD
jgi:site-specific DNA-methyltransferase (adenine-specific)